MRLPPAPMVRSRKAQAGNKQHQRAFCDCGFPIKKTSWLPDPHPSAAAIFGGELDAGRF
jgi:hypothetical protein